MTDSLLSCHTKETVWLITFLFLLTLFIKLGCILKLVAVWNQAICRYKPKNKNRNWIQREKNTTRIQWNSENDTNETFVPELDNPITEHEVRQAIENLKTGMVCGLDDIRGEFLKHADSLVVPFLTNLFNRLYDASHFPLEWCKSVIIPLFKKRRR